MNQKNIEEEHRHLEMHIDKSPFDQSTCYLPLEVQKSPRKVEEECVVDRHSSESTMCIDKTKYHINKAIETKTSPKGFNDKNTLYYRVPESENDVSNEEHVAISMHDMHGNSIDTKIKPLEENRSTGYASVPKIKKCGINLRIGLAETQSSYVSCSDNASCRNRILM